MSSEGVGEMSEESGEKSALVPRLRFSEFLGETLRNLQLGDVTEESGSRNGHKHSASSVMGVTKADGIVPMEARLIAADITRYKLVQNDWFAYNPMRLNIGSIARWKDKREILVSPDYVVFKCRTEGEPGIDPAYLDQFRQTKAWEEFVTEGGDGSVRVRIYYKDIARLRLVLPSLREQQKIADCLSSLDELITVETQKLNTLKTHKKGLMQQLFPCKSETVPRLRFPEFLGAGEWDSKTIGDSCESFSGSTPSTTNKGFYGGEIPFIRSAEIEKDATELFLSNEGLANSAAKMVKVGDILVALYGANSGDVALSKINGAINQAILCLKHETNNRFVYQYLAHKKEWIITTFIQGGQGNLSGEIIKAIGLFFPKPKEQQRIADCLSSLDDLITAQDQKIAALKTHKQGLMQQLFPMLDEVQA